MNGRNSVLNDYTFVSTRGCSVVDYCLIPYENLHSISNFSVIRASSLVTDAGVLGNIDPTSKLPDHSVLRWSFSLDCTFSTSAQSSFLTTRTKYDVRNIPNDFLADESTNDKLTHVIDELESSVQNQHNIDKAYDDFCSSVKHSMGEKLNNKVIKVEFGCSNKKRRVKKPWWNEGLSALWNEMCMNERQWLREKNNLQKQRLKSVFILKRKEFDKAVRKAKRKFKKTNDDDLIEFQTKDQREF